MKKRMIRVREEDAAALAILGREIWEEHYTSILGPEQVAYMVREFQSEPAVLHQMREEQYVYWFFTVDGARAGYLGVQPKENGSLYLSKLYIAKRFRGLGLSRLALNFLMGWCAARGLSKIWLTVNKYNDGSIAAYEALGMKRVRDQVADIGGGFVMDDYVYEIDVPEGGTK